MAETEDIAYLEKTAIRHTIEETRASLTSKLEALEHEVKETAHDAKASVEEQVAEVKQAFNLRYQVTQHPWPFIAGALVLGLAAGKVFKGRRDSGSPSTQPWQTGWLKQNNETALRSSSRVNRDSLVGLDQRNMQFHNTVHKLKSTALGVLFGALREATRNSVPSSLAPHISEVIDSVTKSFGAEPIAGNPLKDFYHDGHAPH